MPTVNINSNWQYNSSSSVVTVEADTSEVFFKISSKYNGYMEYAKAYIPIYNISQYQSITLKYSSFWSEGLYDLYFGVFDSTDPESLSGKVASHTFSESGGTITISDLSSLSGTKYVGFYFYGNATSPGVNNFGYPRASVTISSLTAVESGYTLTYNANGGSGAPSSVSDITSTTISSTVPIRSGYDFLGWSTSPSDTYASYFAGNTISLTSNMTLYAVWRKFYTVTYDANGGSNAPSSDKKIDGQTLVLSGISPTPPTNTSATYMVTFNANGGVCDQDMIAITNIIAYEFINWNTESDGSGVTYQPYELYADNSDITLYAQYTSTTTYNSVFLPTPTRSGYEFLGWAENEYDLSGITGEYTPTSDIVLYATWKRMGNVYIYDDTGGFNPYQVWIYDGSGWNQYIPYIYTESGWEVYSG